MKRLREKAVYQWRVLGWRGCVAEFVMFSVVLIFFAEAAWFASNLSELYAEVFSGLEIAVLFCALCVGICFLTWAANSVWKSFEREYENNHE